MLLRPKHETLNWLRYTLWRLEITPEPDQDAGDVADLKQILLNRIAILQAEESFESYDHGSADRAA